jgi:hypothetical protein
LKDPDDETLTSSPEKIALNGDLAAEIVIVDRHGFFPAIVCSLNTEAERFKSNANAPKTGAKLHGHLIPTFGQSLAHRLFRLVMSMDGIAMCLSAASRSSRFC